MNERILELKAKCIVQERKGTSAFDSYVIDRFDTEKFAELIIKECIEVSIDRGNMHEGLYRTWAIDTTQRIEKHFGVAE